MNPALAEAGRNIRIVVAGVREYDSVRYICSMCVAYLTSRLRRFQNISTRVSTECKMSKPLCIIPNYLLDNTTYSINL